MKNRFDLNKLKTDVFERTGQKISDDDPIFAAVALNESILSEFLIQAAEDMKETEQRLMIVIGALQKAGDDYTKHISEFTNTQTGAINQQIANDVSRAREQFDRDTNAAIKAALSRIENTVKSTVQTEITTPVNKSVKLLRQSGWDKFTTCLLGGLVGGLLVIIMLFFVKEPVREKIFGVQEKPKIEDVRKK